MYIGQFLNGNFDGFGIFHSANGEILKNGLWQMDEFIQEYKKEVMEEENEEEQEQEQEQEQQQEQEEEEEEIDDSAS